MLRKINDAIVGLYSKAKEEPVHLCQLPEPERQLKLKKTAKIHMSTFIGATVLAFLLEPIVLFLKPEITQSIDALDILGKTAIVFAILNISILRSFFSVYASITEKTAYDKIPMFKSIKYSCINSPWNVNPLVTCAMIIPSIYYLMSGVMLQKHVMLPLATPTENSALLAIFSATYPIILAITMFASLSYTPINVRSQKNYEEKSMTIFGLNLGIKPTCAKDLAYGVASLIALFGSLSFFEKNLDNIGNIGVPSITIELNNKTETYQIGGLFGVFRAVGDENRFGNYPSAWLGDALSTVITTTHLSAADIKENFKSIEAIAAMNLSSLKRTDSKLNQKDLTEKEELILRSDYSYQWYTDNYSNGIATEIELLEYLSESNIAGFINAFSTQSDDIIVTIAELKANTELRSIAPVSEMLAKRMQVAGIHDFGFKIDMKRAQESEPELRSETLAKLMHSYEMMSKGTMTVN